MKKQNAIVKQDTSAQIVRAKGAVDNITPWGGVASIVDSFTDCINVWNRERNITERVRAECSAAIEIAMLNVKRMRVQKKAFDAILKDKRKERNLLNKNLDNFWKQVESLDEKFGNLDLEEMKKHQDLLSMYMDFKKDTLAKIETLFSSYYNNRTTGNFLLEKKS